MFCQSFSSLLQRVVPYILVHNPRSIFKDRIIISHTNLNIYPHKRNVDALLKVGVILKVVWLQELRWLLTVVVVVAVAGQYIVCASN